MRELSGDGVGRSCSSSGLRRRGGGFVASQVGLLFSLSFSFLLSFLFCSLFSFLIVLFQSLLEEEVRAPPGEDGQGRQACAEECGSGGEAYCCMLMHVFNC